MKQFNKMPRKKIDIKHRTATLQKNMLDAFEIYQAARKELTPYEGKLVDDVGLEKVNGMLKDIQDKFKEVYPILNFIQVYYQFSTNVINGYADFIEGLKKEGSKEEGRETQVKIVH